MEKWNIQKSWQREHTVVYIMKTRMSGCTVLLLKIKNIKLKSSYQGNEKITITDKQE